MNDITAPKNYRSQFTGGIAVQYYDAAYQSCSNLSTDEIKRRRQLACNLGGGIATPATNEDTYLAETVAYDDYLRINS